MRRVVIGTAGHVDHGKTRLVEALTGIDCDRWAEEKARGITIDLGFAHSTAGDLQLGFVDVPGHERFLHNALAGLGGIRVLLLVVAADEGVKPQTREHLAIASLLGIPAALVALTKADLVDDDLAGLAALEVEDLLATTPFAGAEIVPVSSVTGRGLAELQAKLVALGEAHAVPLDRDRPARLPVDRAFHLKGLGLVVTGTLASGVVAPGDELALLPAGGRVKVRSIEVHGEPRQEAAAGERTSLRIAGVELAQTERGVEIVTPGAFASTRSLLARVRLLPEAEPLAGSTPVRVHLFAGEAMGRLRPLLPTTLEPGATGLVEIRLAAPLVAARRDRLILRRPSPPATWGGGEVLDPAWRKHRGKALAGALAALSGERRAALLFWVQEAGEAGALAAELAERLGEPSSGVERELEAQVEDQRLLVTPASPGAPRRFLAPAAYRRVMERAERLLKEHFQRDRLSLGLPKAEAIERLFPGRAAELGTVYLEWLAAQKKIVLDGGRINPPGRKTELTGEESALSAAVLARFEAGGLAPPAPGDLRAALAAKPQILDGMVRYLVERGRLVRLPDGLVIAAAAVERLKGDLAATGWERFSVPQFKERFGLSRKWAIPLLEHLDSVGTTRRLGDERMVVR